jgi:hypothetical protein
LENLKHLFFKDPQYGASPITMLSNYSLYVLYHLPALISLDNLTISQKVIQEIADVKFQFPNITFKIKLRFLLFFLKSAINKKKMWYYMKIRIIDRQFFEIVERLKHIKSSQTFKLNEESHNICCKIHDLKEFIQARVRIFDSFKKYFLLKKQFKEMNTIVKFKLKGG